MMVDKVQSSLFSVVMRNFTEEESHRLERSGRRGSVKNRQKIFTKFPPNPKQTLVKHPLPIKFVDFVKFQLLDWDDKFLPGTVGD